LPPDETSIEYTFPITYNIPANQYRELKTIVITPSGRRSEVTRAIKYNTGPLKPVNNHGSAIGLKYHLLKGKFNNTEELDNAAVIDSGIVKDLDVSAFKKNNPSFGVIYTGFIRIDADGDYGFSTQSSNGSVLLIDDQVVVDNDGKHRLFEQGGSVPLQKGYHKLTFKYFNSGGRGGLKIFEVAPGMEKTEIAPGSLNN
jgi:hexosaminidase